MTVQLKKKIAVAIMVVLGGLTACMASGKIPEALHVWLPVLMTFLGGCLAALPAVQGDAPAQKEVNAEVAPTVAAPPEVKP